MPELLVVNVSRSVVGEARSKHAVQVEDYGSFPGGSKAELIAVVYDVGEDVKSKKAALGDVSPAGVARCYACAALGQDGCFWFFQDGRTPRRLGKDISGVYRHSVVALLYVLANGRRTKG